MTLTERFEIYKVLLPRIKQKDHGWGKVIPAGQHSVDRTLVLDAGLLSILPARKLYCTDLARIAEDVDTGMLDKANDIY